jgi:hypothetical protein
LEEGVVIRTKAEGYIGEMPMETATATGSSALWSEITYTKKL